MGMILIKNVVCKASNSMDSFMSSLNVSGSSRRPQSARRSRPGEMTLIELSSRIFAPQTNVKQEKIKMRQGSGRSNSIAPTCAMQRSLKLASKTTSGDLRTRLAKDALKKSTRNCEESYVGKKSPTALLRRTF